MKKVRTCEACGHALYLHDGYFCTALDSESTGFCGCRALERAGKVKAVKAL